MLCTVDMHGRCIEVNGAWERNLGFRTAEIRGRRLLDFTHPEVVLGNVRFCVDHAIAAFAQVATTHPDWVLRIFGDGPELARLRRQVISLELHDQVLLLGELVALIVFARWTIPDAFWH